MAICIECGEDYSNRRLELGYKVCLECGEKIANQQYRTMVLEDQIQTSTKQTVNSFNDSLTSRI